MNREIAERDGERDGKTDENQMCAGKHSWSIRLKLLWKDWQLYV